jgi:hypothetical protein
VTEKISDRIKRKIVAANHVIEFVCKNEKVLSIPLRRNTF